MKGTFCHVCATNVIQCYVGHKKYKFAVGRVLLSEKLWMYTIGKKRVLVVVSSVVVLQLKPWWDSSLKNERIFEPFLLIQLVVQTTMVNFHCMDKTQRFFILSSFLLNGRRKVIQICNNIKVIKWFSFYLGITNSHVLLQGKRQNILWME